MQNDIKWSSLPSEILSLIADNSGRDCREVKWMFVNKNWFTFFLSQAYHSISIDLNTNDKKVTKILSSSFDPGKWVRRITFMKIIPPNDMKRLDMLNDPFIQLMKQTPNVKEIQFANDRNLGYMAWTYLSVVLMRTSYWKLHVLPKSGEENLAYSAYYYLCAYHLRNTLKKSYLSVGMVGALDFGFLKEFKTLEMLELDSNLVYNLNDLHLLLRQIPSLKEIVVRFANNRIELSHEQSTEQKEHEYLNLKKLTFHNYTPKLNEDLLVFTEQFTRLNELNIVGEKSSRWPANEVSHAITDIFLDTINSLPNYEITLPGGVQSAYLIGKWLKLMKGSKQEIFLSIIYVNEDSFDHLERGRGSSVTIKACQFSSTLTLQYQIFHRDGTDSTEGRNVLENISDNVSQIEITGTVSDNTRTEMLLRKLISKEQITIKTLILSNTTFNSYSSPNSMVTVRQHIKNVTFRNCTVGINSLKAFINEFALLDYVNFDGCAFEGDLIDGGIDMLNTELGTIYMSNYRKMIAGRQYTNRIQPLVIISVYYASRDTKKYYTITENIITESNKILVDVLIPNLNSDSFVVLNIRVKSLKELILKLTDSYKKVKITF
ncbi:hypothetical protein BD770DRAFT_411341 [Pilaira anomala]|nr:hypothetical protein BD770DRAFT_411341 [Pilaira anomala]